MAWPRNGLKFGPWPDEITSCCCRTLVIWGRNCWCLQRGVSRFPWFRLGPEGSRVSGPVTISSPSRCCCLWNVDRSRLSGMGFPCLGKTRDCHTLMSRSRRRRHLFCSCSCYRWCYCCARDGRCVRSTLKLYNTWIPFRLDYGAWIFWKSFDRLRIET